MVHADMVDDLVGVAIEMLTLLVEVGLQAEVSQSTTGQTGPISMARRSVSLVKCLMTAARWEEEKLTEVARVRDAVTLDTHQPSHGALVMPGCDYCQISDGSSTRSR